MSRSSPNRFSPELYESLRGLKTIRAYPRDSTLFRQGAGVEGLYVIEAGEVRVLLPASHGRPQLLDVAGPGTVLGLAECMSGEPYRFTAEAADHSSVALIPRAAFLDFLRENGDYCMQIVRLLSEDLHGLYHKFRNVSAHPGRPRQRPRDEQLN